jgi:site-specific DNA recombinase
LKEKIIEDGNILVEQFIDEGWTGETLDRPEIARLREKASNGEFEVLYIYHLDRLSRELGNQLYLVGELKRCGIELYTAKGKIEDDPNNKLLMQVHGMVAEQEKIRILERTRNGRLQKAKRGVVVGSIAPYGYSYIKKIDGKDGYYEINKKEAEIVKKIFQLFLELQSIRAVTKRLQDENITPPNKIRWSKSTIHRILTREDYIGVAHYNKYYSVETKKGRERQFKKVVRTGRRLRDKEDWIAIPVPFIVDREIFEFAQNILRNNRDKKRRDTNREYLLSGLITCAICGSTYSGNPHKHYLSYRCNNRTKTFPLPKSCDGSMVKTEIIDNLVWESVKELILSPKIILNHVGKLKNNHSLSASKVDLKIEELKSRLGVLKDKEEKILDVYSDGIINKEIYIEKSEEIKIEVNEIVDSLNNQEELKNSRLDKRFVKDGIRYFSKLAKKRINSLDFNQKKQFINLVLDGISLNTNDRTIKIKTIIPLFNKEKIQEIKPIGGLLSITS